MATRLHPAFCILHSAFCIICGAAIAAPQVWDFTSGALPDGARLRKNGFLSAEGLGSRDFADEASQGGATLTDAMTPTGAFLFEAEFQVGNFAATSKVERTGLIWDDMGISYGGEKCDNTGLEIGLRQQPDGYWTPYAVLGMGNKRFRVEGVKRRLYDGAVTNLSLFFGANGRVIMVFGGLVSETSIPHYGGLAKSKRYKPVVGSRPVSHYWNFDGYIRRVSITPMKIDPAFFATPGRMAFLRGETNAVMELAVANRSGGTLRDLRVEIGQFGEAGLVRKAEYRAEALADGTSLDTPFRIETRIRPGHHTLRATLYARDADGVEVALPQTISYAIGPQVGDRMRTAIWGMPLETPPDVIRDFGFTHSYVYLGLSTAMSTNYTPKTLLNTLDLHLVGGIRTMSMFSPGLCPEGEDAARFQRWGRDGNPAKKKTGSFQIEVAHPKVLGNVRAASALAAGFFANHPSFQGILPYSEKREQSFPSFNTEHLRYKAETGRDVPACVKGPWSAKYSLSEAQKRFPDGVVPDDDEIYLYYRWWHKGGDGWPVLHTVIADEFRKRIGRDDFLSFWDPAVRWAPAWGAGGSLDMLNQWCYAVPEPMNVAGPCEELLAMTDGRPGQKTSIMTQLICYRATLVPKDADIDNPPEWAAKFPDAGFPVVPPDVLQEATWSMIAKPVDAIMYHGWNTIFNNHNKTGYCYTNPESAKRLREVLCGVVAPLGPVLRRLKRDKPQVAVLESLATSVMGGPMTRGWKAPAITCAQRARLDPRVVYEETLERDGFDGIKVLYAPQCQFLPASLVERIREFQKSGGILMADTQCVAVLKPDITLPLMSFDPPPETDHTEDVEAREGEKSAASKTHRGTVEAKRVQQEAAEAMRRALAGHGYRPMSDSSSPEIVVFNRKWKSTPYLFAINDKRTFGDYVGPWGLVMEKGLPYEGWVSIDDPAGGIGAVYELSRGEECVFTREGGRVKVPVKFETNDGRMFVFLERPIEAIDVQVESQPSNRQTVKPSNRHCPGDSIAVAMTVRDADGAPVPALLPVEIRLYDAEGREIDGGGWFCAEGGVAHVAFLTNLDDPPGGYRLFCRDRATGLSKELHVD